MSRATTPFLASVLSLLMLSQPAASDGFQGATIRCHWNDGRAMEYRVFPDLRLFFPTGDALIAIADKPLKWQNPASPFAKNVNFVTVSDTQNRFSVAGVIFENQLFIFDEFLCGQNADTMTRLMLATRTVPTTSEDALRLAGVFLSIANYRFEDPARIIVARKEDISTETPHGPGFSVANLLRIWHAPQAAPSPFGYNVGLFTMYPGNAVEHWRLTIGSRGIADVSNRLGSATYEAFTQPERSPEKPAFQLDIMANGFTQDGASTDIQTWIASDGPPIVRTHYYYKSGDNADGFTNRLLHSAVATLDAGAWFDSNGTAVGKRSTIVFPDDNGHLTAATVFQDGAHPNVLVFSCACLRNLLAVGN